MHSPEEIIISITNRCNLKCKMCDIPENKLNELSISYWKQVIKDAVSSGAGAIVFSGGEPLLREDIFELISFAKNHNLGACLTSNGYCINDNIARKLQQSGIDVVNISIEGPKRIHDYLRGRGMFKRAVLALENLKKHKVETTIATAVSRYNYKYLPHIIEFAKQYGATTVKFQPFSEIFLNNRQRRKEFAISYGEIKKFTQILNDVVRLSSNYAISINPSGYLEMMPFYLSGKYMNMSKGCVALEGSCPINCNGDIYPCWVLAGKDNLIGNIRNDSFLNIWQAQRHKAIIEKIKNQGCPGCMMSCYDGNFGREPIEKRIAMNMRRLQKKGIRQYTRAILKKLAKRIKFYSSYRGSFKGIARRIHSSLQRNKKIPFKFSQEEILSVLKEIEFAKKILKEELSHSK